MKTTLLGLAVLLFCSCNEVPLSFKTEISPKDTIVTVSNGGDVRIRTVKYANYNGVILQETESNIYNFSIVKGKVIFNKDNSFETYEDLLENKGFKLIKYNIK